MFLPGDSLSAALEYMASKRHACVLACENGKPVGLLADSDVVRLAASGILTNPDRQLLLSDGMRVNPVCASAEMDIDEAVPLLLRNKLQHLPVVDVYGLLVGIASLSDLLGAVTAKSSEPPEGAAQHWLSLEDRVTGLPNRRAMEIDLRHTEAVSRRRDEAFGLALLQVDFLQQGQAHEQQDLLMSRVAEIIKGKIRASDKAFRYGSFEFVYLMPGTRAEGAQIASDRLRMAVESAAIDNPESPLNIVTVSGGVAARPGANWQELLKQTENALSRAKDNGPNTVILAE